MVAALLTLVAVAGCQPGKVSEEVQAQLDQKDQRVSDLERQIEAKGNSLDSVQKQNHKLEDSITFLAYQLSSSEREALTLQSKLSQARESFSSSVGQIEDRRMTTDSTLAEVRRELGQAQSILFSYTNQHQAYLKGMTNWIQKWQGHLKWDDYHRHESGRNWAKKLFGAGRGQRPVGVEYVLPAPPVFEFSPQ